jgi:hypothetical protein
MKGKEKTKGKVVDVCRKSYKKQSRRSMGVREPTELISDRRKKQECELAKKKKAQTPKTPRTRAR